ncbi:MAG: hypothetical protein JWP78_2350 [Mucilaginibacter sp.]|nr:hypothetical protein [Mucilaginibacter sp.]
MIYFVLYGILLFIVLVAYLKIGVKLSLFNIFFGLFFLFYGPAFFIYNNDRNLFEADYAIKSVILLSFFVVSYFLGRYLFIARRNGNLLKRTNYNNWLKAHNDHFKLRTSLLRVAIVIIVAVIITGLFFYGGINSLATVVSTPFADEDLINDLRQNAGVTGWIGPVFTYLMAGIARIIAFVFIGWAFEKKAFILKMLSLIFALFVTIAYLANLSKSGFIVYLGQLIFFLLLLFNIRINYKKIILIIIMIIPVFIIIYLFATSARNTSVALQLIAYRVFEEPIRVLELYPYFYPDIYPHTYGMNVRIIHELFSDAKFVPAQVVVSGGQFENVTFNAIFIADAYVDFSYFGVIIQSVFVGYYLSYLDILIFRKNNYMRKALFASLLIGVFSLINAGIIVSFFAFGLFTLPVISYFLTKKRSNHNLML